MEESDAKTRAKAYENLLPTFAERMNRAIDKMNKDLPESERLTPFPDSSDRDDAPHQYPSSRRLLEARSAIWLRQPPAASTSVLR